MNKKVVTRYCLFVVVLLLLIIIPITYAAPGSQLISQFTMPASKNTALLSYSFFSEPASGTLKFHELG